MSVIKLALAKGRLAEETLKLLERAGISCPEMKEKSRKLVFRDQSGMYEFIMVKPSDVPTYVDYGSGRRGCGGQGYPAGGEQAAVRGAGPRLWQMPYVRGRIPGQARGEDNRIALPRGVPSTPRSRAAIMKSDGENVEIIKLNGSVELGPLVGLSDVIVDIVESGATLRANGLDVLETVCDISARLVVNRVSLKTKGNDVKRLIAALKAQLDAAEDK